MGVSSWSFHRADVGTTRKKSGFRSPPPTGFCCWGKQKFIIAFGVLFFIVGPVLTALRKGKPSCAAEAVLGAVLLGSSAMSNVFDTILCLLSTYCGCLMIVWKAEGVLQVCFLAWEIWFYTAKKQQIPGNNETGIPNTKNGAFRWSHEVTALQVEFFVLKRRPQAGIVLTTRRVFQVTKTPRFLGLMGCAFGKTVKKQTDGWWVGGSQPSGPNNKREIKFIQNTSIQEICSNSFTAFRCLQDLDS